MDADPPRHRATGSLHGHKVVRTPVATEKRAELMAMCRAVSLDGLSSECVHRLLLCRHVAWQDSSHIGCADGRGRGHRGRDARPGRSGHGGQICYGRCARYGNAGRYADVERCADARQVQRLRWSRKGCGAGRVRSVLQRGYCNPFGRDGPVHTACRNFTADKRTHRERL